MIKVFLIIIYVTNVGTIARKEYETSDMKVCEHTLRLVSSAVQEVAPWKSQVFCLERKVQ